MLPSNWRNFISASICWYEANVGRKQIIAIVLQSVSSATFTCYVRYSLCSSFMQCILIWHKAGDYEKQITASKVPPSRTNEFSLKLYGISFAVPIAHAMTVVIVFADQSPFFKMADEISRYLVVLRALIWHLFRFLLILQAQCMACYIAPRLSWGSLAPSHITLSSLAPWGSWTAPYTWSPEHSLPFLSSSSGESWLQSPVTLKRTYCHFDKKFCHWLHRKLSFDNFRWSQGRKFHQNGISILVDKDIVFLFAVVRPATGSTAYNLLTIVRTATEHLNIKLKLIFFCC